MRAYIFGQQNFLNLGERPVAAKTGTTNDYRDAWTIGYTPSLAVGVWVGNNDNKEMKRGADGSVVAAPIWHEFMSRVLGETFIETFKDPEALTTGKTVLDGGLAQGLKIKIDKITGKLATNLTPESQVEEKTYLSAHNILHYLNKDDPAGSTLPNLNDPQYQRWEEAVQNWAQQNNIVSQEPPTEYDDVHTLAAKPNIKIINPQANQIINNPLLIANVQINALRRIDRVEYYLNETLVKTVNQPPFNLLVLLDPNQTPNGFYTLRAIVYDDVDNNNFDSLELNLQLSP